MSPAPSFELLRFEATPVAPAVAVVELDGRFSGLDPVRPRLLVETGGTEHEMPALEVGGTPGPGPSDTGSGEPPLRGWSASFAIPLSALSDPLASFALVPGRGPLIELPPPSESAGDDDRFVALARNANDLRHRLTVALEAAAERDHLAAELDALRERFAAAEERVTEAHEAAMRAREEQARAEGEADEARAALALAREQARAEVREEIEVAQRDAETARRQLEEAQERAVAAEDEARAARRDLRDARARVEALVRESRHARTAAAARPRIPTATPRTGDEDDEFRAARLGPDWAGDEEEPDGEDDTVALEPQDAAAQDAPDDDPPRALAPEAEGGDDEPQPEPGDTARLHPVPAAGDAPTTARLSPVAPAGEDEETDEDSPSLWRDDDEAESVRVLRPRTRAGRARPVPMADVDDEQDDDDEGHDDDVLGPAAVGARLIQPAELSPRRRAMAILTHPRVIVGGIFLLLILALVLIFLGIGPV